MAVILRGSEGDPEFVESAMTVAAMHWPETELYEWANGVTVRDKARWIAEHARFWQVWEDLRFVGYIAVVDFGKGRWSFHFGSVRTVNHGRVFCSVWRQLLIIARSHGVRLMLAYLPSKRRDLHRLARIFKFRQFTDTLWAVNLKLLK